jgi:tripartite-type tricarboxylate transporter receptor subunit TctC
MRWAWLLAIAIAIMPEAPTQPIRIIVPYPAGGLSDVFARLIADRLGQALKPRSSVCVSAVGRRRSSRPRLPE